MELMIYLATDNQPFSMCDSIPFQRLLAHFDSRFKVKSGACMARFKLLLLYRNLQMAMKRMFDKELPHCNRVAISTDIWTSRNNEPFMAVTLLRANKKEWTTPIPTDEQLELIATILPLLTTCRVISESMSSDKKITMDRALTAIVHLMDRCASLRVKEIRTNSVTGVGPFMIELIVELEKRFLRGGCDIMPYAVDCLLHPFLKGQQLHAYCVRDEIFDKLKASYPTTADWMSNQQGTINVSDEITHQLLEDDGETEFWKAAAKVIPIKYNIK